MKPSTAITLDERQVRALVRDELRRAFARVADDRTYSTRANCAPPGYSRDAWRALAHRIGVRRGRYYVVSADQLAAYERGEHEPKPAAPANDAPARPWHPGMSAEAAGLRPVGRTR